MLNAFTVDLEDWFCSHNLARAIPVSDWTRCELRVVGSTHRILDLLRRHGVEATFFVLGWIAERAPALVRETEDEGHEIALHGYWHTLLTQTTGDGFRQDLERSIDVVGSLVRRPLLGHRAPAFTLTNRTLWARDVLREYGLAYDSSVYPMSLHPEYGLPDAPLQVHRAANGVVEVPVSCAEVAGHRIPCGGGAYFRALPWPLYRHLVRRCHSQGRPLVFYIHPWEVDPGQPRVSAALSRRLRHCVNLHQTLERLEQLLTSFRFTSVRRLLIQAGHLPASSAGGAA